MASKRSLATTVVALSAGAVVVLGMTGAFAQSDDTIDGASPDALLERLAALETDLPDDVPPTDVEISPETTWGSYDGDAGSVHATLDTLEPDLRDLFVDADDADGEIGEAVASVTRGWLDVWAGTEDLADAESHDLAFPVDTFDDTDVATGADELRGLMETGLDLVLAGRALHLDGYVALRSAGEASPDAQAMFDGRAAAAESFDAEVRPMAARMLSQETTTLSAVVERFETDAPGVDARARSFEVVCLDREQVEEAGGVVDAEILATLAEVDRADCLESEDLTG